MYLYGFVHRSAIEMLAINQINGIAGDLSWRESGELAAIVGLNSRVMVIQPWLF